MRLTCLVEWEFLKHFRTQCFLLVLYNFLMRFPCLRKTMLFTAEVSHNLKLPMTRSAKKLLAWQLRMASQLRNKQFVQETAANQLPFIKPRPKQRHHEKALIAETLHITRPPCGPILPKTTFYKSEGCHYSRCSLHKYRITSRDGFDS